MPWRQGRPGPTEENDVPWRNSRGVNTSTEEEAVPWRTTRPGPETNSVSLPIVDDLVSGFADVSGVGSGVVCTATSPDNYDLNVATGMVTGDFAIGIDWYEIGTFNCGEAQDMVPTDPENGDLKVENAVLFVYKKTRGVEEELPINSCTIVSL